MVTFLSPRLTDVTEISGEWYKGTTPGGTIL